jgi:hypothetical protein
MSSEMVSIELIHLDPKAKLRKEGKSMTNTPYVNIPFRPFI